MLLERVFDGISYHAHPRKTVDYLKSIRPKARQFIFDKEASQKVGRFAFECADLIAKNAEFALPPFPNTYIEIDFAESLKVSSKFGASSDSAGKWGILFTENNEIFPMFGAWPNSPHNSELSLWYYRMRDDSTPIRPGYVAIAPTTSLATFYMGEFEESIRPEVNRYLSHISEVWEMCFLEEVYQSSHGGEMLSETIGQMKRVLATLLLLNQKQSVSLKEVEPQRKIIKGKPVVYMRHSVVTINLNPKRTIRQHFKVNDRQSPRRHEVRATFVHYNLLSGCDHNWKSLELETDEEKVLRWQCADCQAIRRRRKAYERGDASKGFVKKDYEVIAS